MYLASLWRYFDVSKIILEPFSAFSLALFDDFSELVWKSVPCLRRKHYSRYWYRAVYTSKLCPLYCKKIVVFVKRATLTLQKRALASLSDLKSVSVTILMTCGCIPLSVRRWPSKTSLSAPCLHIFCPLYCVKTIVFVERATMTFQKKL